MIAPQVQPAIADDKEFPSLGTVPAAPTQQTLQPPLPQAASSHPHQVRPYWQRCQTSLSTHQMVVKTII